MGEDRPALESISQEWKQALHYSSYDQQKEKGRLRSDLFAKAGFSEEIQLSIGACTIKRRYSPPAAHWFR